MLVRQLLQQKSRRLISALPEETVLEAVYRMNANRIGALVVIGRDGTVEGILTERDILVNLPMDLKAYTVKELMTPEDSLVTVDIEDTLESVMEIFMTRNVRHLPVFEQDELLGIISIGDANKAMLRDCRCRNKLLNEYIHNPFV